MTFAVSSGLAILLFAASAATPTAPLNATARFDGARNALAWR